MKIAMLCGSGEIGGAERSLLDLIASLRQADPSLELVAVIPLHGPLETAAVRAGASVVVVPYPQAVARLGEHRSGAGESLLGTVRLSIGVTRAAFALATYRRTLARALERIAPDVVHSHALKMHVFSVAARPEAAALVWHFHEGIAQRPMMRRLIHRAWRVADRAVAVTHSVAMDVASANGGRLPEVVLNAVDLDRFTPEGPRADLDRLAGLSPAEAGSVRVGIVGTTGRFKGQDIFLRAIARLPRSIKVRAFVVGGPVYATDHSQVGLPQLRSLAEELGIADRVGFTSFVEEVPEVMRALDIVVHATVLPEPFGLVIAEAMACGRAVIASEGGGAAEVVEPEQSGLTHARGNVDELAAALVRLATDPQLRARLGAAGAKRARGSFDRARLAERMLPVYREAMVSRGAQRS